MSPPSTDITGSKLVEHHTLLQTVPWMGHCHGHEEQGYQIAPLKERTFKIGQPHPSFSCTPQSRTKTTLSTNLKKVISHFLFILLYIMYKEESVLL